MFKIQSPQGFTLLELMVVVLVIAILAGIALPQYRFAVEKTRAAERLALATSIFSAQERYYLATHTFADETDDLDITLPFTSNAAKNMGILINNARNEVEIKYPYKTDQPYRIFIQMKSLGYIPLKRGAISCSTAEAAGSLARKLCDSLCGEVNNKTYYTVAGESRCLINYISKDPS